MNSNKKTPGVYINESNTFPNSVSPVATAVPAFIGYTPQALNEEKSCINRAQKITSFADFQAIFCYPKPPVPNLQAKQYNPQYYLIKQKSQPEKGDYILIDGDYYSIVPDPNTIYYLYNSIRLFYQNGGGDAYIVSVGTYGDSSGKPIVPGDQIVNQNVKLDELLKGLTVLKNEQEPTMYICPEATLLSVEENGKLMQAMLSQCSEMQTAISIFDIIGARNPDPKKYFDDIKTFRDNTGTTGLMYGAAYYPFIGTSISQSGEIDYTNLFEGDVTQLGTLLSTVSSPNEYAQSIITDIKNPPASPLTRPQYHDALLNSSMTYKKIIRQVMTDINLLPPSGGMAGVMTVSDNNQGVWHAPANTSIVGAVNLPIRLSDSQQVDLNVDAVSGKSVNAIRFFNLQGILIWGARTLDGNSQEWRYISVRRTMIFLEQSCQLAVRSYASEPNTPNTWAAVTSTISSFLTNVWKEGGLQGAQASDAFSVDCGLGTTMTSDDILNGIMKISIRVAVTRPAEFFLINIQQQMAKTN